MKHFKFIKGQRNTNILVIDNCMYNFERRKGQTNIYRCRNRMCCGKVVLCGDNKNIIQEKSHSLEHSVKDVELVLLKNSVYEKCRKNDENFEHVLSKVISEENILAENISVDLKNIRSSFGRIRKNKLFKTDLADKIDLENIKTLNDNNFIRFDSGPDDINRVLIFVSDFFIEIMQKSTVFYSNSTFKIAPLAFYQLLTIHVDYFNKRIPCLFALMKHKNINSYMYVFRFLSENNIVFKNILIDLEQAQFSSIKEIFPEVNVMLCNFHLGQIFWRYIQNKRLSSDYLTNIEFCLFCRKILSLSYLPVEKLSEGVSVLYGIIESNGYDTKYKVVLDYFVANFMVYEMDNIKFVKNWNLHLRFLKQYPTTTNSLEAWHASLNKKNKPHPNFSLFVNVLKQEEEKTRLICGGLKGGSMIIKKYKNDKKIKTIVNNIGFYSVAEYLDVIANVISIKI